MRKVVLGLGISLDGYIARLDDFVDFLFMPKDYSMGQFFATIDTAVMGRKTYEAGLKMGGGGSFGGYSMIFFVLSRSLPPGERAGVIFTNQSPAGLIAQIRERKGKDIWLMGGGELARDFLKADLVDELLCQSCSARASRCFPAASPSAISRSSKTRPSRTASLR